MLIDVSCFKNWLIIVTCIRFRSLKLWFVMRLYGVEGLQEHIRTQVSSITNIKYFTVQIFFLNLNIFVLKT